MAKCRGIDAPDTPRDVENFKFAFPFPSWLPEEIDDTDLFIAVFRAMANDIENYGKAIKSLLSVNGAGMLDPAKYAFALYRHLDAYLQCLLTSDSESREVLGTFLGDVAETDSKADDGDGTVWRDEDFNITGYGSSKECLFRNDVVVSGGDD